MAKRTSDRAIGLPSLSYLLIWTYAGKSSCTRSRNEENQLLSHIQYALKSRARTNAAFSLQDLASARNLVKVRYSNAGIDARPLSDP